MNHEKMKTISENETGHNFESEEEKQEYIGKVWDKVQKKEWIRKWVRGGCWMGGFLAALIIEMVLWDKLPDWLASPSNYRYRRNMTLLKMLGYLDGLLVGDMTLLEMLGYLGGLLVGEIIARILIKIMKLDE